MRPFLLPYHLECKFFAPTVLFSLFHLKSPASEAPRPKEVVRTLSQGARDAGCNIALPT